MRARIPSVVAGIELWRCVACGQDKPREGFYADKRSASGLKSWCRPCHSAHTIATRDPLGTRVSRRLSARRRREADPEAARAADARPRHRDPVKQRARYLLNNAVRDGRITRPGTCPRCGMSGRVEGHHTDYARPLDVEWRCSTCHAAEHSPLPEPDQAFRRVEGA